MSNRPSCADLRGEKKCGSHTSVGALSPLRRRWVTRAASLSGDWSASSNGWSRMTRIRPGTLGVNWISGRSRPSRTLAKTNSAVRRVPLQTTSRSATKSSVLSTPSWLHNRFFVQIRRAPSVSCSPTSSSSGSMSTSESCRRNAGSRSLSDRSSPNSACMSRSLVTTSEPGGTVRDRMEPRLSALSRAPVSRVRAGTSGASAASSSVLMYLSIASNSWVPSPKRSLRWFRALR